MPSELSAEAEVLLRRIEEVAEEAAGQDEARLTALLVRLARLAPQTSAAWAYAHRLLAERCVEREPWRASLLARRVVGAWPGDDRAWAILGLAQSLLGNHRYAVLAYRRAIELDPHHPIYAHNLGHLYDVALDSPKRALPLLERAHRVLSDNLEVVASFAHALVRAGEARRARELMTPLVRRGASPTHQELYRFIVECDDDKLRELMDRHGSGSLRRRRKRRHTQPVELSVSPSTALTSEPGTDSPAPCGRSKAT